MSLVSTNIETNQSWLQLLSIQAAGALCLPVIMMGHMVCQEYGWLIGLIGIGLGNLFLAILSILFVYLSVHRRQSTVGHAITYFGKNGGPLFASLIILSTLGWFAIQLSVMSLTLENLLGYLGAHTSTLTLNLVLGLVLTVFMCKGMKGMKALSNLSVPLLFLTLLYASYAASGSSIPEATLHVSLPSALSLIIATGIAPVLDIPTFFQHAKSRKEGIIAVCLLFGLVVPFIEGVGLYLSASTGGNTIMDVLTSGHGALWMIWVSLFVLFCGWTTNGSSLYSAAMSFTQGSFSVRILLIGIMGTILSCFPILENLETVLDLIGVVIGSMGAVILVSYLSELFHKKIVSGKLSFVSWGVGSLLSLILIKSPLTGVPVFDAFLFTGCIEAIFHTGVLVRIKKQSKKNGQARASQ